MLSYKTDQEEFWTGSFGNSYVNRNSDMAIADAYEALYRKIFARIDPFGSLLELGANVGMNIRSLRRIYPDASFSCVEINAKAVEKLRLIPDLEIYHQSILDFTPSRRWEMVLIKTVLIHINPEFLNVVYDVLYRSSSRYICLAEYYNTTPVEVPYRGHSEKLFKRDFAGEMLDRHPDLRLLDYGFIYTRDTAVPIRDDLTWFIMEKRGA
ncbi:MAG: pseudaminic acid biosynthesis-associated methylase [Thermodesulfobacteriota bacterium]